MKFIDLETYPRKTHYEFFNKMAYPYTGVCANVDVTDLIAAARKRGGSTFLACLYAAATAAHEIPEFRQRIVDNRIAEFDHCDTAHTVAMPDHTFCNCRTDCRRPFDAFLIYGKECQEEAKKHHGFAGTKEDETDLIFFSCSPWIAFTQVIQPVPVPSDSNPRIVFGKYIQQGERTLLPVATQVNHALMDAYHLGCFYQRFEELAASIR